MTSGEGGGGWKQIRRSNPLPRGRDTHRQEAAQRFVQAWTGGRDRGELGDQLDYLTGRSDRGLAELIGDVGTTKDAAKAAGVSTRTVQRWRKGEIRRLKPDHRDALERAARKSIVTKLGGTKRVAELSGRSESSVRGWTRKRVTVKGDAAHRLNKYEVRQRFTAANPRAHNMKVTGRIRVKLATGSPEYERDRSAELAMNPELMDRIDDAVARGEADRAHRELERWMTEGTESDGEVGYLGQDAGTYSPDTDMGLYVDRLDDVTFD